MLLRLNTQLVQPLEDGKPRSLASVASRRTTTRSPGLGDGLACHHAVTLCCRRRSLIHLKVSSARGRERLRRFVLKG